MTTATIENRDLAFLRKSVSLPSLPSAVVEVVRLTRSDDMEIQDLIDAVGKDPALAARLLRLSNSSLFGAKGEVTNLSQAVMMLGVKSVKLAALSFSLIPMLGKMTDGSDPEATSRQQSAWMRSVTSAVAARELLKGRGNPYAEEAFLCGLLMDLGVSVLCQYLPERYAPVMESLDVGHPSVEVEREVMSCTHAEVTSLLLEQWDLPALIVESVRSHHDVDSLPDDADAAWREMARGLGFAHEVGTLMGSDHQRGDALGQLRAQGIEHFGLQPDEVDAFLESVVDPIYQMAELMEVDIGEHEDVELILNQAREELLTLTVGTTRELDSTKKKVEELEQKATTDALTGIRNRMFFDRLMMNLWKARLSGMSRMSLSVVMVDVDHFKGFNDTYGHQAGDAVLKAVAQTLEASARDEHHVCRYGGEEFVVVMEGLDLEDVEADVDKLRTAIEACRVSTEHGELSVTASFGGAVIHKLPPGLMPPQLIESADKNLYAAKEAGRNRGIVTRYE